MASVIKEAVVGQSLWRDRVRRLSDFVLVMNLVSESRLYLHIAAQFPSLLAIHLLSMLFDHQRYPVYV